MNFRPKKTFKNKRGGKRGFHWRRDVGCFMDRNLRVVNSYLSNYLSDHSSTDNLRFGSSYFVFGEK